MNHFQRQQCRKNFNNNNEYQNISWNEKCDKLVSPSELNEFEKLVLWLDGEAGNPYLGTMVDVGNGRPKPQQYNSQESEQRNLQPIEKNGKFSYMNPYNENAAFNLSFEPKSNVPRRESSLYCLQFDCLSSAEFYTSKAREEIGKYSMPSDISEPVYQTQGDTREKNNTKSSIRDYIDTFTSTLNEPSEMQNSYSFNAISKEDCSVTPDVSSLNAFCNNDDSRHLPKSFEDIFKESFLCYSNISVSEIRCGSFGFTPGQICEESYEERQNQNLSMATSQTLGIEFTNNYKPFLYMNDDLDVNSKAHRRFICLLCGIIFPRKDYLVIHYRKHTGEKPYVCDKCGKGFITNGQLTKHRVSHSTEKPFSCQICSKRFARKTDVTRHLNSHAVEKKYKCPKCGKGFFDHSNRNRHYKKIHNKN